MTTTETFPGPLAGLNVIDFGHYYAGPLAAMLLADQGANVIRIVRPGERELPIQQYRLFNRNKKLLTLDLKTPEGKAQALSLIERADVMIENFRPGVMKRLGLDYGSVKASNPGLVYLSLPGFASLDQERAHIQAWEGVVAAASGMYVDVSYVRKLLNFPPLFNSLPVNSIFGAVHGVVAVMAALLAREADGVGTVIETPLAEAGMTGFVHRFYISAMGPHLTGSFQVRTPGPQREGEKWQEQKANWCEPGDSPEVHFKKLFNAMQAFWDPLYRYYKCADGRQVKVACMFSALRTSRLLRALGIYKQLLSEGFVNVAADELANAASDLVLDNNIGDYAHMSAARKQRLGDLMAKAFLTKTSDEWDALLGTILPFSKVRTRSEYLRLEPMLRSGVLTQMDDGHSTLTVPGRFVDVSGPQATLMTTMQREAESITDAEVDGWFTKRTGTLLSPWRERAPRKKGDLLKGLKVLDVGTWVAGPMSAYVLAQYGADVIKLDAPSSAGLPPPVQFGLGKRSILVDARTAPGQEIFRRLVCWADVVVHNKIDQVAERLGVTQKQLQAINPNVVVGQVSAFGGTLRGGWERRFGLDPIPQAVTGLMAHYGTVDEPHDFEGTMIADALSGFGLAFASLLGVWQRRRTGCAGEVRASLVRAGSLFQLPYMIAENGSSEWGEVSGQSAMGVHWWQRIYRCSDGWIYVGTNEDRACLLASTVLGSQQADDHLLEAAFKRKGCAYWLARLDQAEIACHKVLSLDDICNRGMRRVDNDEADETAYGAGEIIYWEDPPCGHPLVLQAMDWVRVGEDYSWKRVKPTPRHGQDSRSILRQMGYSEAEIANLVDLKVVA